MELFQRLRKIVKIYAAEHHSDVRFSRHGLDIFFSYGDVDVRIPIFVDRKLSGQAAKEKIVDVLRRFYEAQDVDAGVLMSIQCSNGDFNSAFTHLFGYKNFLLGLVVAVAMGFGVNIRSSSFSLVRDGKKVQFSVPSYDNRFSYDSEVDVDDVSPAKIIGPRFVHDFELSVLQSASKGLVKANSLDAFYAATTIKASLEHFARGLYVASLL